MKSKSGTVSTKVRALPWLRSLVWVTWLLLVMAWFYLLLTTGQSETKAGLSALALVALLGGLLIPQMLALSICLSIDVSLRGDSHEPLTVLLISAATCLVGTGIATGVVTRLPTGSESEAFGYLAMAFAPLALLVSPIVACLVYLTVRVIVRATGRAKSTV